MPVCLDEGVIAVGRVADPIVRQLCDVSIRERGAPFDLHAQESEEFGGDANQGDVADQNDLDKGFAILALMGA